jgi:hypothetical protein
MMTNLLKYRDKRIRAKTDIASGRLVLHGPRFEKCHPKTPIGQGVDVRDPNSARHAQFHGAYEVRKYRDAGEADVSQEVAFNLCVKQPLAELISGGAFSVTERPDGIHLIEKWWPNLSWGAPHALFQAIEKVEVVTDVFNLERDIPVPRGTQFRVRAADFFAGCGPNSCTWEGEELKEGHLRILRPSPVSKQVALRQQDQATMLRALWQKVMPDQAIGAAK